MEFASVEFVLFLLVAVITLYRVASFRHRLFLMTAFNIIFISSFAETPLELIPILIFAVTGYCAILMVGRWTSHLVRLSGLLLIIGGFIWLKQYSILSFAHSLDNPYVLIGLSYILFRVIHLLIDVSEGAQTTPSPLEFFNYIFFFLTFTSGPIQRYPDFYLQVSKPQLLKNKIEINQSITRLLNGFLLIVVVSPMMFWVSEKLTKYFFLSSQLRDDATQLGVLLGVTATCQLLHLYINFSGYMSICIGIGRLIGHDIPENFKAPYDAKNFLDLWTRWHITLSQWFKTYLFNPLLKSLASKYPHYSTPYFGALAFFVTFMVMGIWHGTSNIFMVYGLLLGSGVTINKLWQVLMEKYLGRTKYKSLSKRVWYSHVSRSLALSFFSLSVTCIWISPAQVNLLGFKQLFIYGLIGWIAVTVFLFLTLWLLDTLISWISQISKAFTVGQIAGAVINGLKLIVIVNFTAAVGSDIPPFIYEGF
jgi:alginate O-acetyltransferase complex protein AlgI